MSSTKALVDIGGGMKSIYGAGVLDALYDNQIRFDNYLGVSAGCANIGSFIAGQRGRNKRFFSEYSLRKEYIGFENYLKTGSFFGLSYIYDTLSAPDGEDPFDTEAFLADSAPAEFVATVASTGEAKYFNKEDFAVHGCRIFSASCAVPVMCRPVEIDNVAYYDGGVAEPIPYKRALEYGCDKVFFIIANPLNEARGPERHRTIYYNALRRYPIIREMIDKRHFVYAEQLKAVRDLENEGRALIFSPSSPLGVTTTTRDVSMLERQYKMGYEDALVILEKHL